MKPHGTEAAYVRHRRYGEVPCDDCAMGMSLGRSLRRRLGRGLDADALHGTAERWVTGCRCSLCVGAVQGYAASWAANRVRS